MSTHVTKVNKSNSAKLCNIMLYVYSFQVKTTNNIENELL